MARCGGLLTPAFLAKNRFGALNGGLIRMHVTDPSNGFARRAALLPATKGSPSFW